MRIFEFFSFYCSQVCVIVVIPYYPHIVHWESYNLGLVQWCKVQLFMNYWEQVHCLAMTHVWIRFLKAIWNHWRYGFLDHKEQPYSIGEYLSISYKIQTEINVMHIRSVQEADPLEYNPLENNLKGSINGLIPYCEFLVYPVNNLKGSTNGLIPYRKFMIYLGIHSIFILFLSYLLFILSKLNWDNLFTYRILCFF